MNWNPDQPPSWQPPGWQPGDGTTFTPPSPSAGRKPRTRKVSVKSVSMAIAGPEQPYPVYQFSNQAFTERKGHNPFSGL